MSRRTRLRPRSVTLTPAEIRRVSVAVVALRHLLRDELALELLYAIADAWCRIALPEDR